MKLVKVKVSMDQPLPLGNQEISTIKFDWDQNNYKDKEKCTICCPCKCAYVTTRVCCLSCRDCCKGNAISQLQMYRS